MPVYYDLETTGFGSEARVVQLGALCGRRSFSQLVRPDVRIPAAATAVHGIDDEKVRGAPAFREAWDRFLRFVEAAAGPASSALLLVGYNNWSYDDKTLHVELKRAGLPPDEAFSARDVWTADVLRALRALRRSQGGEKLSLRLGDVYERLLGQPLDGAHDALADCRATHAIAERSGVLLECGPFREGGLPVEKRRKIEIPARRIWRPPCSWPCQCRKTVSRFFTCSCGGWTGVT